MTIENLKVAPEGLRLVCDPNIFGFEDTSKLTPLRDFIGQERAIKALRLGFEIETAGYNIFATSLQGTGRRAVIKEEIEKFVKEKEGRGGFKLSDLIYVYNFNESDKPALLIFKKGAGRDFKKQIEGTLPELKKAIPTSLQKEDFRKAEADLVQEFVKKDAELHNLSRLEAEKRGVAMIDDPRHGGVDLLPLIKAAKGLIVVSENDLLEKEKKSFEDNRTEVGEIINKNAFESKKFREEMERKVEALRKRVIGELVKGIFKPIIAKYRANPNALQYIKGLKIFTLKNIDLFMPKQNQQPQMFGMMGMMMPPMDNNHDEFLPFRVNLIVDNSETSGAPVIFEDFPTFANLLGKIGKKPVQGTLHTDHTKIEAGSLISANGGYLVLNLLDALRNPGVWQKLEKTLKTGSLKFDDPTEYLFGISMSEGLRPESISINTKVIVIGNREFYYLLCEYDEDFPAVFKIKADFDYETKRSDGVPESYARFIATCCEKEKLLPFDRTGVAKVVEHCGRLVSSQKKVSTQFSLIKNLVVESECFAKIAASPVVTGDHVRKAIEAKKERANLPEEKIQEWFDDGVFLIDLSGQKIGQINALAVYNHGDLAFGRPSRVTAETFMGKGEIVRSTDKEAKMSGPIFNKAILTISGWLGKMYAQKSPLALSISLAFEQSYGGIEGDSASMAEVLAILSSLCNLPLRQDLAITGSMNQKGETQAIGGANEKIEGFFDVCKARELTNTQGVAIPDSNTRDLMLREDVVEAVRDGKFTVYKIKTIDEAIELFFGKKAGELKEDGTYPEDTVNYLVAKKLAEFSAQNFKQNNNNT